MDRTASKDGLEMVSRQNTVTITSNEANYDGNIDVSRELPNRHRASSFVQNMTASQTDKLVRESKALKARIDQLEKENSALKRSLFDLSVQYSAFDQPKQSGKPFIFDLANALKRDSPEEEYADQRSSNDTKTYGFKHDLNGHNGAVYAVQYSPCSKFIASGSIDKTLKLWEMASSQKEVSVLTHEAGVPDFRSPQCVGMLSISWTSTGQMTLLDCSVAATTRPAGYGTSKGRNKSTWQAWTALCRPSCLILLTTIYSSLELPGISWSPQTLGNKAMFEVWRMTP